MDVSSLLAMRPNVLNWYVLRVMSGQEKKVKDYLEAEIKTWSQKDVVAQILVPSERVYEMRGGKKRTKDRNFFPGYICTSGGFTFCGGDS